uniref:ALA-interacting subunit n=1 Tax=Leersia perrieri TaxID=77586 RepID=A0A0D9VNT1_9ORYZ
MGLISWAQINIPPPREACGPSKPIGPRKRVPLRPCTTCNRRIVRLVGFSLSLFHSPSLSAFLHRPPFPDAAHHRSLTSSSPSPWIWVAAMDPLESEVDSRKSNNKPRYSKFTQQELPACKPLLTPGIVISAFLLIGVIFVPIGLASLSASQEIVELVDRYDANCVPASDKVEFIQNSDTDKTCTRTLTVPKHMKSPIQIYYQIGDFYQNHRRYVKSRSDKQLRYKNAVHLTKDCDPEGNTIDGAPIVPCGLIAWSMFNDTYTISVNKKAINVNKKDIAWKSDKTSKFGSDIYPSNFQKGSLIGGAKLNESIPLSEQEDLIVWMRTAALPTFRKLYGRIETDIMANDQVTVVIQNNYNTYSFGGSKALVLSTTSWIGGKNSFIGVAYLTIGGLCIFLAVGFVVLLYMVKPSSSCCFCLIFYEFTDP